MPTPDTANVDRAEAEPVILSSDPHARRAGRRVAGRAVLAAVFAAAVTLGALTFVMVLTIELRQAWLLPITLPLPIIAAVFSVILAYQTYRQWHVLRGIGDRVQLLITAQGVEYDCAAGMYSAPWAAVRRLTATGDPKETGRYSPTLHVDVAALGGPLTELGPVCHVTMPVAHPDQLVSVGEFARQATGGRLGILMASWE